MIYAKDNALPEEIFKSLQEYCDRVKFVITEVGEKKFLVANTPENVLEQIQMEGHKVILSFLRKAHKDFDTSPRIHADGIIGGQKPKLASVLYVNDPKDVTPNGTAFWEHTRHGIELGEDVSKEEFDQLLMEDANQKENFTMTDKIMARPNRMLVYNANLFHSKWPFRITKGERIVLVNFYIEL